MKITCLYNVLLQCGQNGLFESIEAVAFEIIKKRDTKLLLIGALDDSQIGLQNRLLVRLEVVEQVRLY